MVQKISTEMMQAEAGDPNRALHVDATGKVTAGPQGVSQALQDQVNANTFGLIALETAYVTGTVTQWSADNWTIFPLSIPDATEVKLLDIALDTDINTEVSDVFDRLAIASHQTNPHNVIKTVYRGGTTVHDIRLTFSLTAGNNQFYRIEVRRGGDDSVVLRQVVERNPDEAEQTVTLKTFTYKADDPYVTDGFYIALVNDSGLASELNGRYSLTVFSSYQYLTEVD